MHRHLSSTTPMVLCDCASVVSLCVLFVYGDGIGAGPDPLHEDISRSFQDFMDHARNHTQRITQMSLLIGHLIASAHM